jgi:hypothetical protein
VIELKVSHAKASRVVNRWIYGLIVRITNSNPFANVNTGECSSEISLEIGDRSVRVALTEREINALVYMLRDARRDLLEFKKGWE